jgi:hypothetical protein
MTPSELMKAMADAGAPFEAILIAMSALDVKDAEIAARDAGVASKRQKDAERKREDRAVRRQSKARPRTVQGQSTDPSPNEYISNPHPTKPSGLVSAPKRHQLPVDWEPMPFKAGTQAAMIVARWEPGRLERELAKFRDHHTAAGTKWENGSQDFERGSSGNQHHPNHGLGKSAAAAVRAFGDPASWAGQSF